MRKTSLASNMKIRTSIILVLVFYLLMLIAGAALGVLSLRAGNMSLDSIVQNQRAGAALAQAVDGYRNIQSSLTRAANARVFGTISDVESELREGRGHRDAAQAAFNRFQEIAANTEAESQLAQQITQRYEALMSRGVAPMLDALARGEDGEYEHLRDYIVPPLERELFDSWNALQRAQQAVIDSTYQGEIDQYELVVKLVAVGMLACFLIAFLTYAFLNRMVLRPLRVAGSHADRIAGGDLTQRIHVDSSNEIGVLLQAMARMQDSLTHIVGTVRRGVEEINVGAHEIYLGNTDLSDRTERQAASLQQTAASMEQLSSTVQQNTEHATEADRLVKGAAEVAQRGGSAVSAVVGTMGEISDSSHKMAEIVSVIDGIAFQTNILALNAAVEAARAGEQGRGFAVVASEVRSLAGRSAEAAREIKTLISASVERVAQGNALVDRAGATMGEVVGAIRRVTDIVGEISAASHEQSLGVAQVGEAVTQMDQVTQQNAALVEEMAAAASSLKNQAEDLVQVVAVFRLGDERSHSGMLRLQ